jgi:hypothetical protein
MIPSPPMYCVHKLTSCSQQVLQIPKLKACKQLLFMHPFPVMNTAPTLSEQMCTKLPAQSVSQGKKAPMSRSPDTVSAHSPILPCFLSFAQHVELLAHCVEIWRHYQKCCSTLHTLTRMAVVSLHYVAKFTLWVQFCHGGALPFRTLLSVATHIDMLSSLVCSLGLYLILRHNVL